MSKYNTHFNSELELIQGEWFCKCCSKGFCKFLKGFIDLNSPCLRDFDDLRKSKRVLRNSQKKMVNGIKTLLGLIDVIKNVLPGSRNTSYRQYTGFIRDFKEKKLPIIESDDEIFNKFIKAHTNNRKKYLTFNDITEFYKLCEDEDYLRSDIYNQGLDIHVDDIEYLEKKYKMKYPLDFPREEERGGMNFEDYIDLNNIDTYDKCYNIGGFVYVSRISYESCIILNYLSFIYCNKCFTTRTYFECISEKMYLLSSTVSLIFNNMCIPMCLTLLHTDKFIKYRKTVSFKLHEIKNDWDKPPLCCEWKGVARYHEKLGILPKILYHAGVSEDHYRYRVWTYFTDSICGHYMASNGWFAEALQEAIDDGMIVENVEVDAA